MTPLDNAAVCRAINLLGREVPTPVDVTDAEAFPEIARALAHAESMTPEYRASLWEGM